MIKKINLILTAFVFILLVSCNSNSNDDPPKNDNDTTNNGGGGNNVTGINLNPDFSFSFNGKKISFSKIEALYGGKIYFTGYDNLGEYSLDMGLPALKGVLIKDKPFTIGEYQYTGRSLYLESEEKKWYFDGGKINITKNTSNTVSGTFNAKAYLLDFTNPDKPERLDSVTVTDGVFNNIKVKG
ncbi:MAG: hypothetical protein HUU47_09105 [Bacteroidetes bacterium]|nr:hypothetical protein [Bacteroidota bacterium]